MKRMILIRAALFAVFAFMGTISLSAQSWLPPSAAVVVIGNELNALQSSSKPSGYSLTTKEALLEANTKVGGCSDCFLNSVKRQFFERTAEKLKLGANDTGVAVEEVRAFLIANSNNNPTVLSTIQTAYQYVKSKLQ